MPAMQVEGSEVRSLASMGKLRMAVDICKHRPGAWEKGQAPELAG